MIAACQLGPLKANRKMLQNQFTYSSIILMDFLSPDCIASANSVKLFNMATFPFGYVLYVYTFCKSKSVCLCQVSIHLLYRWLTRRGHTGLSTIELHSFVANLICTTALSGPSSAICIIRPVTVTSHEPFRRFTSPATIVCSAGSSGQQQRKHQNFQWYFWSFMRGIHRSHIDGFPFQ